MIVVRIHGWRDPDRWTKPTGWYVRNLARRLTEYTNLPKRECEALAKRVLMDRECLEIPLSKVADRWDAHSSFRSFLDSFGADTTVAEVDLSNPPPTD